MNILYRLTKKIYAFIKFNPAHDPHTHMDVLRLFSRTKNITTVFFINIVGIISKPKYNYIYSYFIFLLNRLIFLSHKPLVASHKAATPYSPYFVCDFLFLIFFQMNMSLRLSTIILPYLTNPTL